MRGISQSPIKRNNRLACSGLGLEEHLTAFFDPKTREKQENENGMTQFYAMQLRDENKTIENLRDEVNRLRTGDHSKVSSLQEKMTELKI